MLLSAGCDDGLRRSEGASGRSGSGADEPAAGAASAESPPPGPVRSDTASTEPAETEGTGAALALDPDGLRIFLDSGSARPVPFGSPADAATRAIAGALGAAPLEEGSNADCALDFATWEGDLTTSFSGGRFVGWFVRSPGSRFTTAAGVGVGSTRTEWESAHVLEIRRSSLGVEFSSGGISGILESAEPDARVLHLWAGQVCLAR